MAQWRKEKQFFLDATLRREGLGDAMEDPECAHCDKSLRSERAESERIFRCTECGDFLQCLECCLHHHRMSPLHFLEVCNHLISVSEHGLKLLSRNGRVTTGERRH